MAATAAVLTRQQLDTLSCATPGCDHTTHDGLILSARCHSRRGVQAKYQDGILTFTCGICGSFIAKVAVKESSG